MKSFSDQKRLLKARDKEKKNRIKSERLEMQIQLTTNSTEEVTLVTQKKKMKKSRQSISDSVNVKIDGVGLTYLEQAAVVTGKVDTCHEPETRKNIDSHDFSSQSAKVQKSKNEEKASSDVQFGKKRELDVELEVAAGPRICNSTRRFSLK